MRMQKIQLIHGNCETEIQKLPDESVDVILTDPPYLYLKNQKWDKPFNEDLLFSEWKRVLKDTGMVVMFGRGESFYRWNYKLAQLGFKFKEELIWDKITSSSPVAKLNRVHETASIYSKRKGKIIKVKVPYIEIRKFDPHKIEKDLRTIVAKLNNFTKLQQMQDFIDNGVIIYKEKATVNHCATLRSGALRKNRLNSEVSRIHEGMVERSIIKIPVKQHNRLHSTEKPSELMERLLNIVVEPNTNAMVLDTFAGSGSVAIASYNLGHSFIGYELDEDFYTKAKSRIEKHIAEAERAKQCETQSLGL